MVERSCKGKASQHTSTQVLVLCKTVGQDQTEQEGDGVRRGLGVLGFPSSFAHGMHRSGHGAELIWKRTRTREKSSAHPLMYPMQQDSHQKMLAMCRKSSVGGL